MSFPRVWYKESMNVTATYNRRTGAVRIHKADCVALNKAGKKKLEVVFIENIPAMDLKNDPEYIETVIERNNPAAWCKCTKEE